MNALDIRTEQAPAWYLIVSHLHLPTDGGLVEASRQQIQLNINLCPSPPHQSTQTRLPDVHTKTPQPPEDNSPPPSSVKWIKG